MKWEPERGCVWQEALAPNALQGQELSCHGCPEFGVSLPQGASGAALCLVQKEKGKKP